MELSSINASVKRDLAIQSVSKILQNATNSALTAAGVVPSKNLTAVLSLAAIPLLKKFSPTPEISELLDMAHLDPSTMTSLFSLFPASPKQYGANRPWFQFLRGARVVGTRSLTSKDGDQSGIVFLLENEKELVISKYSDCCGRADFESHNLEALDKIDEVRETIIPGEYGEQVSKLTLTMKSGDEVILLWKECESCRGGFSHPVLNIQAGKLAE